MQSDCLKDESLLILFVVLLESGQSRGDQLSKVAYYCLIFVVESENWYPLLVHFLILRIYFRVLEMWGKNLQCQQHIFLREGMC